jgi:2-dehydropantoate 2-reductase
MACLMGARLARAGSRVTLVGTWPEGLRAIAAQGLAVAEDGGTWHAPAAALPLEAPPPPADAVLVLVKSWQTAAVAPHAVRAAGPSLLVTLQNGLGNREVLAAAGGRPLQGVTVMGATLLAPGLVRGFPGQVWLEEAAAALAGWLREGGFDAHAVPDIDRHLWRKLAVNCAINPLSAVLGVPNGDLLREPEPLATLDAAAAEVGAVAAAAGVALDPEEAVAAARAVARATAGNRSSMLQDLERGGRTEIGALCGAVVEAGARRGVPTPVNARLHAAVRAREAAALAAVP